MRKPSRLKAYTSEVNKARKLRREAGKLLEKAIELEVKASLPGVSGRRVVASS